MADKTPPDQSRARVSRRGLLLGATAAGGLAVGAGAAGAAGAFASTRPGTKADTLDTVDLGKAYPFYGTGPQAGISTPPQRYTVYMTFNLTTTLPSGLQVLLARWSGAIAQLMAGQPIGQVEPGRPDAVGADTGEAFGLAPASLTVTVGLGPSVFTDAYGLTGQKPPLLRNLRQLPSDSLDPALTGGDLSLQACADDPQVAYHAIRDLARIAKDSGSAETSWTVLGFGRASAGIGQSTPRNLLGFKDGTRNLKEPPELEKFVWVKDGPQWQRQGTYQVARKIQMDIENWDTDRVSDQNRVFGRHKQSGAPLTGTHEFDAPEFAAKAAGGTPVIDPAAHIALASFENNNGLRLLRRSYNYTDGINQVGLLDAGLLFISYQNDPAHFETLQTKLGASDLLNEYVTHIGSAIFFIPPAPAPGSYIGEPMFG
jgi:deferrochelatase/peroxidase EfeB